MYSYIQNVTRQIPTAKEVVPDIETGFCIHNTRFTKKLVYLINAGGISLFKIWSSVVCTVSFPTCRRKKDIL